MNRFCSLCGDYGRTIRFRRGYVCEKCRMDIRRINISELAAPGKPAEIDYSGDTRGNSASRAITFNSYSL